MATIQRRCKASFSLPNHDKFAARLTSSTASKTHEVTLVNSPSLDCERPASDGVGSFTNCTISVVGCNDTLSEFATVAAAVDSAGVCSSFNVEGSRMVLEASLNAEVTTLVVLDEELVVIFGLSVLGVEARKLEGSVLGEEMVRPLM